MEKERFTEKMLKLLPYWHYKIDKPFKMFLKDKMSLETYYCLQVLRQNGPMTMTELSSSLKISKQQATKIIDTLYRHHFVARSNQENDRRFITICVTDTAIDYIEQTIYGNMEFAGFLEKQLGAEDMKQLESAVDVLIGVLSKLE